MLIPEADSNWAAWFALTQQATSLVRSHYVSCFSPNAANAGPFSLLQSGTSFLVKSLELLVEGLRIEVGLELH